MSNGIEETENQVGLEPNEQEQDQQQEVVEQQQQPEQPEQSEDPDKDLEYVKGELPEESTRKAIEKAQRVAERERDETGKFKKAESDAKSHQQQQLQQHNNKQHDIDPDLKPHPRFDKGQLKAFQGWPDDAKRSFNRMARELQSTTTKTNEEVAKERDEIRGFKESIIPFASKWAEQKIPWTEGVLSLARAQEKLTNPETSLKTFVELGVDLGHISKEEMQTLLNNHNNNPSHIVNQQISPLQQRIDALEQELGQSRQERQQAEALKQAEPIVNQMRTVVNERLGDGNLRYPELQSPETLNALRPRISELVGTDPTLSYGEALRLAAHEQRQRFGYALPQSSPNRPLAVQQNSNQFNDNATRAATVTVRGKVAPADFTSQKFNWSDAPKEALKTPEDSVRYVLEQLANQRG